MNLQVVCAYFTAFANQSCRIIISEVFQFYVNEYKDGNVSVILSRKNGNGFYPGHIKISKYVKCQ